MENIKCPWNKELDLPLVEDQDLDAFHDNRTVLKFPAGKAVSIKVEPVLGMLYRVHLEPAGDDVLKNMCITTERGQYENRVPYVPPNIPSMKAVANAFCEDDEEGRKTQPSELQVEDVFWVHVWGNKEEDTGVFKLFVDAKPVY